MTPPGTALPAGAFSGTQGQALPVREEALVIACAGDHLVGVVSHPAAPVDIGVVVVVGGPQYRIGSHRQFVLLARALAAAGFPVLRFDYRSMGDGSGEQRDFLEVHDDIAAAVDALQQRCPTVRRVVLWGLCDGASAALLYLHRARDPRIAGLCLLNPWVRSAVSLARTQIRHYYVRRLMQPEFWNKLLRGGVALKAARDLLGNVKAARGPQHEPGSTAPASYQERMASAWQRFDGDILLMLSELDYTAKEFLEYVQMQPAWAGALVRQNLKRQDLAGADHTFSNAVDRGLVIQATVEWLSQVHRRATPPA